MIYVGIDPGTTGAIAFLRKDGARVFDLPTVDLPGEGSVRRRVHGPGLSQLLMTHAAGDSVLATLEDLSAGGRDSSAQTVGSQYRTRGTLETTLELLGLQPKIVLASRWKRLYGLAGKAADDKAGAKAIQLARGLYPELADQLKRVADHNRAEAVLIAHWARKTSEGSPL